MCIANVSFCLYVEGREGGRTAVCRFGCACVYRCKHNSDLRAG